MKKNKEIFLFQSLHKSTKRNYVGRMLDKKVYRSEIARKYGKLYWDGSRKFGYGGYRYINNYWTNFAKNLIKKYKLNNNSTILDIGCGKAFLLFEIKKILPNIKVYGIDISKYALQCAPKLIKKNLFHLKAQDNLKKIWKKKQFDLVISMGCLHNLSISDLLISFENINYLSKKSYVMIESYRNVSELFNLQCWALTCNSFFSKLEWIWLFKKYKYNGDYEFIYFS